MKRNRIIYWGIFFILAAVAAIATQLSGGIVGLHWSQAIWGLLLVMVIIESAVHLCFTGIFLPLGIAYNIFGGLIGLPAMAAWVPVLAGGLLGIGLDILTSGVKRKRRRERCGESGYHRHSHGNWENSQRIREGNEENYPKVDLSFGSLHRYVNSGQLEGGDFSVSCGELKVDLTDTIPVPGAEIRLTCSLGELELIVPRHWNLQEDIQASLGGIDYKGRRVEIRDDSPDIRITGDVSLGSISIMYV